MLILMRRTGETIMIGDNVTLTVLEISGGRVRIGINAPKEIPVNREEIHERIKRERQGDDLNGNVENTARAPEAGFAR